MKPARKHLNQLEADEADLPQDLLDLKRGMEAQGFRVRLPKPGAKWIEREPIDFGVSVSDFVIRDRGKEP